MPESANPDAEFVDVYDRKTGIKQTIPTEWLDHPVLGLPFRKTPLSEKQQRDADALIEASGSTTTNAPA